MTILHLPESFFPAKGGGKEVYTLRFAQALQSLGTTNVVAIHGNDDSINEYEYEGIAVRVLPSIKHTTPYKNRYTRTVDSLPRFSELLDELQPDVVHFHDQNNGASLSHLRIVKNKGIKAVVTFHTPGQVCPQHALLQAGKEICDGTLTDIRCTACQLQSFFKLPKTLSNSFAFWSRFGWNNPRGKIQKLLSHRKMTNLFISSYFEFTQLADKTIVFTNWAKQTYIRNGIDGSKLAMIDTGGNASIQWDENKEYRTGDVFEICYIGRCEEIKGIHLLVDAVMQVDKSIPVKVFFYSHSWDKTEYGRMLLRKIANDSRFVQPCLVDNKQLPHIIASHHVCVIPSIWPETGPLTVFDAFGSGLPIIGTNSAGIADRVRDGVDGLLFENGSVNDLKSKIETLLRNPEIYSYLRNNIKANRTMSNVADETLKMYESILT